MITLTELFPIGYAAKTHGIKGEINLRLDTDFNPEDFRFLVFEIDAIFVPFEIVSSRGKGIDNRLVSLKNVTTVEEARIFLGKTAYVLNSELKNHPDYQSDDSSEGLYLSDLIGYQLYNEANNRLGEIIGYNDDTQNFLLELLLPDNRKVFVPYVDEWLTDLNQENKTISFDFPEGLID